MKCDKKPREVLPRVLLSRAGYEGYKRTGLNEQVADSACKRFAAKRKTVVCHNVQVYLFNLSPAAAHSCQPQRGKAVQAGNPCSLADSHQRFYCV